MVMHPNQKLVSRLLKAVMMKSRASNWCYTLIFIIEHTSRSSYTILLRLNIIFMNSTVGVGRAVDFTF